jgi:hypothetical protein
MDYLKDLLCGVPNCAKRGYQVACFGDQCVSGCCFRACMDKLFMIRRCMDKDCQVGDMSTTFLCECCCFASICCICTVPACAYSVICCDFNKINYIKYYDFNTKTLSFENKQRELDKFVTLSMGDIPADTEIINFGIMDNLVIKSKRTCGSIENVFPRSVKKIINFSSLTPLEEILLPENLEYLSFSNMFDKTIPKNFIPEKVKTVQIYCYSKNKISKENLPKNLETLEIGDVPIESLPENLITLKIKEEYSYVLDNLPTTLKVLEIQFLNQELTNLPFTLEKLIIEMCPTRLKDKIKIPFGCKTEIRFVDECTIDLE